MKITLLAVGLSLSFAVFAQTSCYRAGAKDCPTSGATLLDDTYPVASYVISVSPYIQTDRPEKVPTDFILKVMKSFQYADNAPNIIVPANAEDFERLKAALEAEIKASNGKIPESVLSKVVPAGGNSFTWQQDYFESFFDPNTGRPVTRRMGTYINTDVPAAMTGLSQAAQSCEITDGGAIQTDLKGYTATGPGRSFGSGEMGGNIEGLPGGLCLVGDNQSPEFTQQYCGDAQNVVQIDVSWLTVGHVDEVAKIVPTNRPGVPRECQFSLMLASPDKALELLKNSRSSNHPLISGDFLKDGATASELEAFRESRSDGKPGNVLCGILRTVEPKRSAPATESAPARAKQASYKVFDFIMNRAHADVSFGSGACQIDTLTNKEFVDNYAGSDMEAYNLKVSEAMKSNREKILAKLAERLPQCVPHIQVIEAPDLFYGQLAHNSDGTTSLPKPGRGGSLFPNPTNSVVMNNGIIFPDPQNPLFRDYLSSEMRKRGMNSDFIDTWDYAHLGDGNLHCASHSLPYCSPVSTRRTAR